MKKILWPICAFLIITASYAAAADAEIENSSKKKILVGSPIRQKPAILKEFLESLSHQDQKGYTLDFFFVDDNDNEESHKLLQDFCNKQGDRCLIASAETNENQDAYVCDETTHNWNEKLIWKVAGYKNRMIEKALKGNYDYLFLIDSDILLYPQTITQLIDAKKEIVSEIFWTIWQPNTTSLPQVWLYDQYIQLEIYPRETLTQQEVPLRMSAFLEQLKKPGVYEVGGLGASTLISKSALQKGVNFNKVKNISFWGEDRHFCVRAAALGIPLFVDTHYPAYHIYRESELSGVEEFKKKAYGAS